MYHAPVSYPRAVARCACFLVLLSASFSRAQEISWRTDYLSARREASEKNRPLLIDIVSDNCAWCVKLDVTTFRDATLVTLINERYVPLKLNAQQDPAFAAKLGIETWPTLVLARPDGVILDRAPGYVEAGPLQDKLQRILASLSVPDWMARDYQAAGQAIAGSDYTRALALLKTVVEDGKDRPIQVKARQLLQELEQQAAGRLARVKQLVDKGQANEAMETTTELIRVFSGTQAAVEASRMLTSMAGTPDNRAQQRTRQAREYLALAREDFRSRQYQACLSHCEMLANGYADLAEGGEAMQLAAQIKNNPEWMRQACDNLSEQLGSMYLTLAEAYVQKGQPQQAALCLERVVQGFPGSRPAEIASVRLSQIQGQPTRPVDFKK